MKLRIYRSRGSKEFRWTLISPNGKKFANGGESFIRKDHLIKRCKKNIPSIKKVEDLTIPKNERA